MKEIRLGPHHKSVVEKREKTKLIDIGIKRSLEFDVGDDVNIFAGEEPIAEGIIQNVTLTSVSAVTNELLAGVSTEKMTSNQLLEVLNEKYAETLGRKLTSKDAVTVIEWKYKG